MAKEQLAFTPMIRVDHADDRNAAHTYVPEQRLLDLVPALFISYLGRDQGIALDRILEQAELADQLFGQESA